MRLKIELPALDITAGAMLYDQAAPRVAPFIWNALETPLETQTSHACFDGHEMYCFINPSEPAPPVENITIRPQIGDIIYFHAPAGRFAAVSADARLRGPGADVHELAFCYGEVDLRHYWEEGWIGSIVGHVDEGLEDFARGCLGTLDQGRTTLRISRSH